MSFVTVSMKPAAANGTVRREIERLLQDVVPMRTAPIAAPLGLGSESATGFSIELDVPGIAPENIEVVAEDGVLFVRGNRGASSPSADSRLLFNERASGAFERRFRLPKSADLASISADYAYGVLTLHVAKHAATAPRRVQVNVATSKVENTNV